MYLLSHVHQEYDGDACTHIATFIDIDQAKRWAQLDYRTEYGELKWSTDDPTYVTAMIRSNGYETDMWEIVSLTEDPEPGTRLEGVR
jgi:hypothetical protein